jgi:hypothetical protein
MDTAPAITDLPVQVPQRHGRLILLVAGSILLIAASSWLPAPGNLFWVWFIANSAVTLAGLLLFAVVTALMDMRQRTRWLVVLAVLSAESLLLTMGELVGSADYRWVNLVRLVSWQGSLAMQLIIGLGTVLAVHTLLWPIRAILGWQVHWAGEQPSGRERLLTRWHLAAWVALMAILVIGAGSSMNSVRTMGMVLLMEFTSLLAGLPVLILATRRKHLPFWIPGVLAGLIGLSWAEAEVTFFITKATGSSNGVPVWFLGIWNGAVAGTVLITAFLLCWVGLEFHLPLSRREAALRRASTDGTPANTLARREFQFSLRSLLILTTLLCLGPGAYIAWERDQCHRGTEILVQIDKLGGLMEPDSQPRPAWLRAVLGDNAFRQVYIISLEKSNVVDADLAQLSGLPGLQTLWLGNSQVTDTGLASLSHLKSLGGLSLDGTRITDKGLVQLSHLKRLESLGIDATAVSDAGLLHLPASLKSLGLVHTMVGDAGLIHLPADLQVLGLRNTKVTDAGMPAISRLSRLENLNLGNDAISDAGLKHLEGLRELKILALNNTQVTDAGLVSISRLTNLEYLYFDNQAISDAGLAQLEGLPNLKVLVVTKTQVTAAGAAKLNRKLPLLKIHR